jgi:hypothetical protein
MKWLKCPVLSVYILIAYSTNLDIFKKTKMLEKLLICGDVYRKL